MKGQFIDSRYFIEHLASQESDAPKQRKLDPELRRTDSDYEFEKDEEFGSVYDDSNSTLENYLNKKYPMAKECTNKMTIDFLAQRRLVKKLVTHMMPPIRHFP